MVNLQLKQYRTKYVKRFCAILFIKNYTNFYKYGIIKATPHKARQKTLHVINLQIFRHLTHNFFTIRQYAFKNSMQSDGKYICVSATQALCGIALRQSIKWEYEQNE